MFREIGAEGLIRSAMYSIMCEITGLYPATESSHVAITCITVDQREIINKYKHAQLRMKCSKLDYHLYSYMC